MDRTASTLLLPFVLFSAPPEFPCLEFPCLDHACLGPRPSVALHTASTGSSAASGSEVQGLMPVDCMFSVERAMADVMPTGFKRGIGRDRDQFRNGMLAVSLWTGRAPNVMKSPPRGKPRRP